MNLVLPDKVSRSNYEVEFATDFAIHCAITFINWRSVLMMESNTAEALTTCRDCLCRQVGKFRILGMIKDGTPDTGTYPNLISSSTDYEFRLARLQVKI